MTALLLENLADVTESVKWHVSSLSFFSLTGLMSGGAAQVSICKQVFKGVSTSYLWQTGGCEMRLVHMYPVPQ